MRNQPNRGGFTLVELSIVLVIIGLVVAGVTAGQSLIKAGELRKVVSEVQGIKSAINAFRLQYDNHLPGDFPNATDYWPTCPNHGAGNWCSGDGDGLIEPASDSRRITTTSKSLEADRAAQHLSLAEIIPGNYNGSHYLAGDSHVTSTVSNGFHRIESGNPVSFPYGRDGNYIMFNGNDNGGQSWDGILTSEDARSIDVKIDDGVPIDGQVFAVNDDGGGSGCTSVAYYSTTGTGQYTFGVGTKSCSMLFWGIDH